MRKFFTVALLIFVVFSSYQNGFSQTIWRGIVCDSMSRELLTGAAINTGHGGAISNNGVFEVSIDLPAHIRISYPGYETKTLFISNLKDAPDSVLLRSTEKQFNEVVITAGKREQNVGEITQSTALIKPDFLLKQQVNFINEVMEKIPGVQVQKDQMTIRGVSGFSYGIGSRVMILLDEMPLLSADASDAKWSYFPVENLDRVEILKGASSVLYGSSALEGIVHLRTAVAADTPQTTIKTFLGFYDPHGYKISEVGSGRKYGLTVSERMKIGSFKVTASVNGYMDDGYRIGDHDDLKRGNLFVLYTPKKNDKWILSGAINAMRNDGEDFVFFGDANTPWIPFKGTTSEFHSKRWNADFNIKYFPGNSTKHVIRGRVYSTINRNNTGQSSTGRMYFSEYQFQKSLFEHTTFKTNLITGSTLIINSVYGQAIYGNHTGYNPSGYFQMETKYRRFLLSSGARYELFKIDSSKFSGMPVFRIGINYQPREGTYLRACIGQGFRYPSVAELFARTQSGAIKIFPNDSLLSEKGHSEELGIRQLIKIKGFRGFLDASAFRSRYNNMIEYQFGLYLPAVYDPREIINYLGFKAKNMSKTEIFGFELSSGGEFIRKRFSIDFTGGITRIYPYDVNYKSYDTVLRNKYLKYRREWLLRGTVDARLGKLNCGIAGFYDSEMKNIDRIFLDMIPSLKPNNYWQKFSTGKVIDFRLGYELSRHLKIDAFCKNVFNKIYMDVPGNSNSPRTYILQLTALF